MNFWEFADKHSVGLAWTVIMIMLFLTIMVTNIAQAL